jgi:hypothetical protein
LEVVKRARVQTLLRDQRRVTGVRYGFRTSNDAPETMHEALVDNVVIATGGFAAGDRSKRLV